MVDIIAHRGYWIKKSEKNTLKAFQRAFSLNFGVETDIRDYKGKLVVSHDIPAKHHLRLETLLELYRNCSQTGVLALNIKSDGLQGKLRILLERFKISNYFVFDMSFPEQLLYSKLHFSVFTRQSEYERDPLLYNPANGVWLDEFDKHWIDARIVKKHIRNNKSVCLVSPELHKRRFYGMWRDYRSWTRMNDTVQKFLCTDFPEKARGYFNEKN